MEKENNFSAIHLGAALLVVLGHQFLLMGSPVPTVLGVDIHGLGVRMIFVMSGYLITESYLRSKSVWQYLKKRLVRIFPPFVLCVFLTVAVIGPIFTTCDLKEYVAGVPGYLIKNIALKPVFNLPGVFQENVNQTAVNGSLWTLPIEMACYLILIAFMKIYEFLHKRRPFTADFFYGLVGVFVWGYYVLRITGICRQLWIFWGTDWVNAVEVAVYFLWGSIFSRLNLKKFCNLQFAVVLWLMCSCMYGVFQAFMILPVITYTVISFAFADKPLFAKAIRTNISYGIYLWAFPIQQVLIQLITIRKGVYLQPIIMFLISIVFIWIMAYMSYFVVEKPILQLAGGRKDRR